MRFFLLDRQTAAQRCIKALLYVAMLAAFFTPSRLCSQAIIFADNFNAGALDLSKWRKDSNPKHFATVANNVLELHSELATTSWIITRNTFAARNTTVRLKVAQPNDDGCVGISPTYAPSARHGIYEESNWYRFYTFRPIPEGPYQLYAQWKKDDVLGELEVTGNLSINGTVYLRLRFDAAMIYFEASLDGATWIDTYHEPFQLPGYSLDSPFYCELAGYSTPSNGVIAFDDFSIANNNDTGDIEPPQISNLTASNITANQAQITWLTNESADSQVEYGLTTSYGVSTPLDPTLVVSHSMTLSNLQMNTSYHYRVKSKDAAGNLTTSGDFTFTTLPATPGFEVTLEAETMPIKTTGDLRPPGWVLWDNGYIAQNVVFPVSGAYQFTLRAQGDFVAGEWSQAELRLDQAPRTVITVNSSTYTEFVVNLTVSAGMHQVALAFINDYWDPPNDRNLRVDWLRIQSTDATDTQPPIISNVAASNITTSAATITWTTDKISDSQVEYGLTTSYGASTPLNLALVASHVVTLSDLQTGATYHYRVRSKDAAGNLAVGNDATFTTKSSTPTTVPLYKPFEVILSSTAGYDNSYLEAKVMGVFTSPTGQILRLKGFWDGGSTWRIRFSPNEPGVWTYHTESGDANFITAGSFQAVPATPAKAGFVRVSKARPDQFERSDGSPFLLMGDTNWDGMSSGVGFETRFKPYINQRRAQSFNAYHTIVVHNRYDYQNNEGGAPFSMFNEETRDYDRLNPNFFKWVDKRVAYADSLGMVSILFFTWADEVSRMTTEQYERLALYLVSRYAAYEVFWVLAGDYQSYFPQPQVYNQVGQAVAAADPFDHPLSIHPSDSFTNREFANEPWLSYIMHQLRDAGEFLADSIRADRVYNKPVVNGEYGYHVPASVHPYHGITQNADYTRTGGWSIFSAGGYFVAGFHHTFYDPNGHYPYDPGFDLPPTYWDLADPADQEAARQYGFFFNFFQNQTNWPALTPHRELVLDGQTELLADPGKEYVAYHARGGRMRVQLPANQHFSLSWFDPIAETLYPARIFKSTGETMLITPTATLDGAVVLRPVPAPSLVTVGEVSGLQREQVDIRHVRFQWQTPEPADSRADLQLPDGRRIQVFDRKETTQHELILEELRNDMVYVVTLSSQTADGREWKSTPQNFSTAVNVMDEWIEAEQMPIKTVGHAESPGWNLNAEGYLATSLHFPQAGRYRFELRGRGEYRSQAWPEVMWQIEGATFATLAAQSAVYKTFTVESPVGGGTHEVKIVFANPGDNRQLIIDWLHVQFIDTATVANTIFGDDFNSGELNLTNWQKGENTGNDAGVTNDALELRSAVSETGWIVTRKAFAPRNTAVQIKVSQPSDDGNLGMSPTYALSSAYGIYNQPNWYRFYTYREESSGPYRLFVQWKKGGVEGGLDVTGGLVITAALYLRLRFDETRIHFEVSFDGAIWTEAYTEAFALPGYTLDSAFHYELAGYSAPSNGVMIVDEFSITRLAALHAAAKSAAANELAGALPVAFNLQNYPNPFRLSTRIAFALREALEVELKVFDVTGRLVRNLSATSFPAGSHEVLWDGKKNDAVDAVSGIYFVHLRYRAAEASNWTQQVRRVMMLR